MGESYFLPNHNRFTIRQLQTAQTARLEALARLATDGYKETMVSLDPLIAGLVVLCATLGFLSGFAVQVASFLSIVAGVAAVVLFGPLASDAMQRWTAEKALATMIGYLAVFCAASMAVRILAVLVGHMLKRWKLEKIDRAAGTALGAVKGLAIAAIVAVILGRFGTPRLRNAVRESFLASNVVWLADVAIGKSREIGFEDKASDASTSFQKAAEKLRKQSGIAPPGSGKRDGEKTAEEER